MGNSIYKINKGVNKSIEFHGLKAQYIWYFIGGILLLLILFAMLYIVGLNSVLSISIILGLGGLMTIRLYGLSNKYGEYGLMKKLAKRKIPKAVRSYSRYIFFKKIIIIIILTVFNHIF